MIFFKRLLIIILLPMTLLFIWFFLQKMAYFRVKHITINGVPVSDSQVYRILDKDFKKNIYNLSLNDIRKRLQLIYAVQRVSILRKYPSTLEVELLENKIVAFIRHIGYKKKPLYML